MKQSKRRIVVFCKDGQAWYVKSGVLNDRQSKFGPYASFLKLTKSRRYAARFEHEQREEFIGAIHMSASMGFYPQYKIEYCS